MPGKLGNLMGHAAGSLRAGIMWAYGYSTWHYEMPNAGSLPRTLGLLNGVLFNLALKQVFVPDVPSIYEPHVLALTSATTPNTRLLDYNNLLRN